MYEKDNTKYRLDIDGLRALAVIPVVLYHAKLPGLSGGFTGVDIFFVISGFLITRILYIELEQTGGLSIGEFYARRIRRILPSLIIVTATALLGGYIFLSASLFEVHDLAKSAVAVMAFVANLYFLTQNDYFAAAAESTPLLHCWSLAIEEQYYLFWPLLLMAAYRIGRRVGRSRQICAIVVALLSAGSLIACAVAMDCCAVAAFYLPVTRAWELGAGSALGLVALSRFNVSKQWAGTASIVGMALISASVILMHERRGFPFPWALMPVSGAALVLWGNMFAPGGPVARLLMTRPLVSIGRVSYAWYLWHWPLLSFAHILTLGEASPLLQGALVAASLALAYLTTWLVERPVRFGYGAAISPRMTIASGALAAGVVIVASSAAYLAARNGLLEGQPSIAAAYRDRPGRQPLCLLGSKRGDGRLEPACMSPDMAGIVLWGDSLASQWSPALERIAAAQGRTEEFEQLTMAACPPLIGLTPTDPTGQAHAPYLACRDFNAAVLEHLAAAKRSRRSMVMLASNWAGRAMPPTSAGASRRQEYFDVRSRTMDESLTYLEAALEATIQRLAEQGFAVLLVLQPPIHHHSVPACIARWGADKCFKTLAEHLDEATPVNEVLRRVASRHDRVLLFDPVDVLCEGVRCPGQIAGKIAYYDALHLSASFAGSERPTSALQALFEGLPAWEGRSTH